MCQRSRIVSINGEEIVDFQHLATAVAVNGKDPMDIVAATEATTGVYTVTPAFDEEDGIYRIGVPFGFDPTRGSSCAPGPPRLRQASRKAIDCSRSSAERRASRWIGSSWGR